METEKDKELWKIARKHVNFKRHLFTYLIVNIFLWCLWLMSNKNGQGAIPWPAWSTIGWGIGLGFDYVNSYLLNRNDAVEKEYKRLKEKQ